MGSDFDDFRAAFFDLLAFSIATSYINRGPKRYLTGSSFDNIRAAVFDLASSIATSWYYTETGAIIDQRICDREKSRDKIPRHVCA